MPNSTPWTTPTPPPDRLLVTTRDAARMLALSDRTLWTLRQRGTLRAVLIGGAVRYDVADLRDFIARSKTGGVA